MAKNHQSSRTLTDNIASKDCRTRETMDWRQLNSVAKQGCGNEKPGMHSNTIGRKSNPGTKPKADTDGKFDPLKYYDRLPTKVIEPKNKKRRS